jgi:hypothetical protein
MSQPIKKKRKKQNNCKWLNEMEGVCAVMALVTLVSRGYALGMCYHDEVCVVTTSSQHQLHR